MEVWLSDISPLVVLCNSAVRKELESVSTALNTEHCEMLISWNT